MQTFNLFIGGEWVEPSGGNYLPDTNPWTGECLAQVADASEADVEKAVAAALAAQQEWARWLPSRREKVLLNAADLLEQQKEEHIQWLCEESGSSLAKASHEVGFVINLFRAAAGECRRVCGETMPSETPGLVSMVVRRPLGVIAAIGPFNYPFLLLTNKVAFGIAAGNALVIKSSSETPAIAYQIAQLVDRAGAPKGLVNAISGRGSELGDLLTLHPDVKMVAFTGSTTVGRHINQLAASQFKKTTLELGGKSAMIIFDDADLEYAVNCAAFGIFDHQGQICMVNSRILVQRSMLEAFIERFRLKAQALSIGGATERQVVIGPLINEKQRNHVDRHVRDALDKGATLVTGGTFDALFYAPTILTDVNPTMALYREETFGPVAIVIPFDTVEHAIELANDSDFGLSAAVLTNDITRALTVAQALDTGAVHINDSAVYDEPMSPHGGVKQSGMGREGGHYSIEEYTQAKWITVCTQPRRYPF